MILIKILVVELIFLSTCLAEEQGGNYLTRFYYKQKQRLLDFALGSDEDNSIENSVNVLRHNETTNELFAPLVWPDPDAFMEYPDIMLSVPAIIAKNGYNCETHTLVSQGYILNIHRIPRSKDGGEVSDKTVFLQHGLLGSSADWILNGPEKALAYVLADAGYDVWISNIRGNRYSREHALYKTDSASYWDFSWHDVALNDIPAVLDFIQKFKGSRANITYIGHSMGTTMLFAMLTLRPEYNDKLSAGFALAPVVYMSDFKSPLLKLLSPLAGKVATLDSLFGNNEFLPKKSTLGKLFGSCTADGIDFLLCKKILFTIIGKDEKQINRKLLPLFLAHIGTGTPWKTVVHFAQEVENEGKFQQFDYGQYENDMIYGSVIPPEYDLCKVKCPIKLFWAENDLLSSKTDVMKLYTRLDPETTEIYKVPAREFNHLDYLWALDAPRLINDKILESLDEVFKNK